MKNKNYEARENVVIKHIDSSMPKEKYQTDTILLLNYVIYHGYKYLFTMVDHFTKYGWIETLKEKNSNNYFESI